MNWQYFADAQLVNDLGMTLVDSLWQIGLISLVLYGVLGLMKHAAPNSRYLLAVAAFTLSFLVPAVTFVSRTAGGIDVQPALGVRSVNDIAVSDTGQSGSPSDLERNTSVVLMTGSADSIVAPAYLPAGLPIAVAIWLAGVAACSLRLFAGLWQIGRYRRRCDAQPGEWAGRFEQLRSEIGVAGRVKLLASKDLATPIAVGILRPAIIIPASAFLQVRPEELETVIAHELIHLRRYDPLMNLLQTVIETVLFYHPCVWWMSATIRNEREFAADAEVLRTFSNSHVTYANALAHLEVIRQSTDRAVTSLAAAANGGKLMNRIHRILNRDQRTAGGRPAWAAATAFFLISALLLAVFAFRSSQDVSAQKHSTGRKLAIGFVSIPPLDRTNTYQDGEETMRQLIHVLKTHKVPATGFLAGGMISDGERMLTDRAKVARMWVDAGYEVGLGGFKHVWLSHTPVYDYIANIEKNERVAKKLLGDMGFPPRYYSYPYLNTGKSEDRAKVESWLTSRGYTSVKYTIDNQEWMYSYTYDMARQAGDEKQMKKVRTAYLDYISKMFDHYEAYSSEMFGRDIAQTMVLTSSRLVVDTADDFFAMTAKRGYSLVTVDEAQGDPAYKTPENFEGPSGISWFERWSMARGKPLRNEPTVDAAVEQVWNDHKGKTK